LNNWERNLREAERNQELKFQYINPKILKHHKVDLDKLRG